MADGFVVHGKPKSLQAKPKGKNGWKATVRGEAPGSLVARADEVRMRVVFFFDGSTDLDVDNILKPICDALNGVAYVDDSQITEIASTKWDLQSLPTLIDPPLDVTAAIATGDDFVYIRVDDAPTEARFD